MPGRGQRGFALLIVLWSIVLLTLLVTRMTGAGRTDLKLAENLRGAAQAEAAADGLVYAAAYHLLNPQDPWTADGRPRTVPLPGASGTVQIDNEAGKVNPNTAAPLLLRALLHQLGTDPQLAAQLAGAIADWRFAVTGNGAKDPPYRAAGLAYAPPGAPFESVSEIGAVLGMTPALLDRLRPYLSVLTDTEPDIRLAAPAVIAAIAEATGTPAVPAGPPPRPRTVTITATAITTDGSRFTRRATIRLGANKDEMLVRVLTWGVPGA